MTGYTNQQDRNDFNIAASQTVQGDFQRIAGELEAALNRRDSDVKAALADYQADGVSDEYAALEAQWTVAGTQIREVINTLRGALETNDEIATAALSKARASLPI